jgi:hypothetical protein
MVQASVQAVQGQLRVARVESAADEGTLAAAALLETALVEQTIVLKLERGIETLQIRLGCVQQFI